MKPAGLISLQVLLMSALVAHGQINPGRAVGGRLMVTEGTRRADSVSFPVAEYEAPCNVLGAMLPGLYLVDTTGSLLRLAASPASIVGTQPGLSGKRRDVLRLSGLRAGTVMCDAVVFYLRLSIDSTSQDSTPGQQYPLAIDPIDSPQVVRFQLSQGQREVETMVMNCYNRRRRIDPDRLVPLDIERLSTDLYRLRSRELPEGEYAVLLAPLDMHSHGPRPVFDFSIRKAVTTNNPKP